MIGVFKNGEVRQICRCAMCENISQRLKSPGGDLRLAVGPGRGVVAQLPADGAEG